MGRLSCDIDLELGLSESVWNWMFEDIGRWDEVFAAPLWSVSRFSRPDPTRRLCNISSPCELLRRGLDIALTRQSASGTHKDPSPMVACHCLLAFARRRFATASP